MKKFKFNFFLIIFFISSMLSGTESKLETEIRYELIDGKIFSILNKQYKELNISGEVKFFTENEGNLYYVKKEIKKPADWENELIFGYISEKIKFEKEIPLELTSGYLIDFFAHDSVVFLISEKHERKTLLRLNINTMKIDSLNDIDGAALINGRICIIRGIDSEKIVIYNGKKISVNIKGDLYIGGVMDERIIFISNGPEVELVDMKNMISLYQYSDHKNYPMPEKFNLNIQLSDIDIKNKSVENYIFYKIFINGVEKGRTKTGNSFDLKNFDILLNPGKYYLIKIERWGLDRNRKKFIKLNNIYQPEKNNIFIPMNRVLRLSIKYDGVKYFYENLILTK